MDENDAHIDESISETGYFVEEFKPDLLTNCPTLPYANPSLHRRLSMERHEQKRKVSQKSRDALLGVKPVFKKKRNLNGKHIQAIIPETLFEIPEDGIADLNDAIVEGAERAKKLQKRRTSITESEFVQEQQKFHSLAKGNAGFFHMLMAVFLGQLYLSIVSVNRKQGHVVREGLRNMYTVVAMAQRELAQTCLQLSDAEIARMHEWPDRINIQKRWWRDQLTGALSVAQLCHLFLKEGATVRFSRIDEDLDWKIDLIVSFRGISDGLCVQAKSEYRTSLLGYRTFNGVNPEVMDDKDRRFVNGVKYFQNKFRGIWTPVEIIVGTKPRVITTVRSSEENSKIISEMLRLIIG